MNGNAKPVPTMMLAVLASFMVVVLDAPRAGHAQVVQAKSGDRVDQFMTPDIDGVILSTEDFGGKTWFLAFVAAHQRRSERALADLADLVAARRDAGHVVDLLIVISGGEGVDTFRARRDALPPGSRLLLDPGDALWGRLGVVVTPTTLLVDGDRTIRWFRAGHSFDFSTQARINLDLALGLAVPAARAAPTGAPPGAPPDVLPDARTGEMKANDAIANRARRHQRMAQVLARRGDVESAITEIRKARDLTPDAFAINAELAHLLCRKGKNDAALAAIAELRPATAPERARAAMLTGWALRQRGDLDRARPLLEDAVALDPDSADSGRALYELGKLFEQQDDCRRAMGMYRRALDARQWE